MASCIFVFMYCNGVEKNIYYNDRNTQNCLYSSRQIFRVDYRNKVSQNKITTVLLSTSQVTKMIF